MYRGQQFRFDRLPTLETTSAQLLLKFMQHLWSLHALKLNGVKTLSAHETDS